MKEEPTFYCDAMLGGLARWLRAAGYDTRFDAHVRDGALVRRCLEQGRCLLTSDSGLLERYAITQGLVRHVFVPRGQTPVRQLGHVMGKLGLELRPARCMDCNGELVVVKLDQVAPQVPPRAREAYDEFFRCAGCHNVYWRGTHWEDISRKLRRAAALARGQQA